MAFAALDVMGIPVLREGNILDLTTQRLSVVEACSGIRSLLSLTFLSLVYGYFFEKRRWVRGLLFAATIPIAIVANGSRVTMTGLLSQIQAGAGGRLLSRVHRLGDFHDRAGHSDRLPSTRESALPASLRTGDTLEFSEQQICPRAYPSAPDPGSGLLRHCGAAGRHPPVMSLSLFPTAFSGWQMVKDIPVEKEIRTS